MPRIFLSSLRSRAIILVLLALLPLLALTFYSYLHHRAQAVKEMQRDELVAARNLAAVQEVLIRNTRQLLVSLSQLPQVKGRDREGCAALFAGLLKQSPQYTIIAAADCEGRVFASAPAGPAGPVNVADRVWFQKALESRSFFVGEPLLGRISRKYSLNMSYPILDNEGRIQGALVAGVDLTWLGDLLAKSDLPAGAALALTDASGKALFRYPEPLKYTGRMLPEILVQAMAAQTEGVLEVVGLPGDLRLVGFTRLAPPWQDLRVAVALPKVQALAQVNRELRANLFWLGLVSLVALSAAWYGAGLFVVRPVKELRGVTEKLAAGDLTVRTGPQYPAGELGLLGQAFDGMADAIQERDARLKEGAAELGRRVRELNERTAQLEAAVKELESFSYTVSHDLRAPLRGIAGFSRILLEDYRDRLDEEGKRHLGIIIKQTQKMGNLIDDLLVFSRYGRREMHPKEFKMEDLARAVFNDLQEHEPGRNLQLEVKPMPTARGDLDMIRRVLVNLLANALKFTREREPAVIEVSGRSEGHENVYCVQDNGVGFEMEYVDKLFGVFQRLHPEEEFEGTGVGLAIVHRIITRHGGRVWAEGRVGEGARFCFTLPKDDPATTDG
jgi:signal transduction histidine kinase